MSAVNPALPRHIGDMIAADAKGAEERPSARSAQPRNRDESEIHGPAACSDAQDKALMIRIAKGDEEALRELIEKHQGAVYGTISKMLGDPVEAQDLAQQVFVRVYRAAGAYRATAQFKTWMFTIVRNLVFNEHRRRSRATFVSLHPPENESSSSGGSTGYDLPDLATRTPGENALHQEMLRAIDEAILTLPEQQRLAIVLRRYDEFSYEEIARILTTSVPATKSLLFRARETLRVALKDYLETEKGAVSPVKIVRNRI
ncbi:MAG: sigma-70 family RNA polymerase sigma factor [Methylacidiphilales bacterium]|nr:sigma-70 family RNA polymerase sigma factor [Candidatus Methylacidiphilales bacterium]